MQKKFEKLFSDAWIVRSGEQALLDAYGEWLTQLQSWNTDPRKQNGLRQAHGGPPVWDKPEMPLHTLQACVGSSAPVLMARQLSRGHGQSCLPESLLHRGGDTSLDPWSRQHILML